MQEAVAWQESAGAWVDRLLKSFPAYRDLLQPVALAVYEVRNGLALLVEGVAMDRPSHEQPDVQAVAEVISELMAFPWPFWPRATLAMGKLCKAFLPSPISIRLSCCSKVSSGNPCLKPVLQAC